MDLEVVGVGQRVERQSGLGRANEAQHRPVEALDRAARDDVGPVQGAEDGLHEPLPRGVLVGVEHIELGLDVEPHLVRTALGQQGDEVGQPRNRIEPWRMQSGELGVRQERHDLAAVGAFVTDHRHPVGADVDVALQRGHPHREGVAERGQRVLRRQARPAAVGLQVEAQLTHSLSCRTSPAGSSLAGATWRLVTPDSWKAAIRSLT